MVNKFLTILFILALGFGDNVYANTNGLSKLNSDESIVELNSGPSDDYRLYQNFPNPFNPATMISYKLSKDGFVSLSVFNLVGQEVAALVNEFHEAGTYTKRFDATGLSAGVYLYKLQVNGYTSVKRMTIIK